MISIYSIQTHKNAGFNKIRNQNKIREKKCRQAISQLNGLCVFLKSGLCRVANDHADLAMHSKKTISFESVMAKNVASDSDKPRKKTSKQY